MSFVSFLLQAENVANAAGGGFGMLLPLILIIAIMYFLMIRPQNKKQKELQKMLDALKKGDKVVTVGGIRGTIAQVKKDSNTVLIKVDDNVKIEFNRSAVANLLCEKSPPKTQSAEDAKGEKKSLFGKKKGKELSAPSEEKADKSEEAAEQITEGDQKEAKEAKDE